MNFRIPSQLQSSARSLKNSALNGPRVNNTTTGQHPKHTVLCVSPPASLRNHQQHRRVGPRYVARSLIFARHTEILHHTDPECVHIKPAVPHPNLPTLDRTPLPSLKPHPPSRNSPIASPTEENSTQSKPPVQTPLQQPATETATPNETESPETHADTSDNTDNPVSEANQVRLRPSPESATTENTRTRTRIIKPPSRFRDYELT